MTIVLHFHDDNHPISSQQKNELEKVIQDPKFKAIGAYRVRHKSEKALEAFVRVSAPATLVVYKGTEERGRTTGEISAARLKKLLELGL